MMNLIHVSARPMAHEYYGLVPLHHELKWIAFLWSIHRFFNALYVAQRPTCICKHKPTYKYEWTDQVNRKEIHFIFWVNFWINCHIDLWCEHRFLKFFFIYRIHTVHGSDVCHAVYELAWWKAKTAKNEEKRQWHKFCAKIFWKWFAIRIDIKWKFVPCLVHWNVFNGTSRIQKHLKTKDICKKWTIINEHQILGSIQRRVKHESSIKFHFVFNSFIFFFLPPLLLLSLTFHSISYPFVRFVHSFQLFIENVGSHQSYSSFKEQRTTGWLNEFPYIEMCMKDEISDRKSKKKKRMLFDRTFSSYCK